MQLYSLLDIAVLSMFESAHTTIRKDIDGADQFLRVLTVWPPEWRVEVAPRADDAVYEHDEDDSCNAPIS